MNTTPTRSRAYSGSERLDVGVPAWTTVGGVRRGRKAGPQPPRQEPLRAPLPQPPALLGTRDEIEKDTSSSVLRAEPLDGALHQDEHRAAKAGHQRLREGPLQADEQFCLW